MTERLFDSNAEPRIGARNASEVAAPSEVRIQLSATERLVEVAEELSMARDLAAIMAVVRRAGRELTGADGATFVLREGDHCFYADEDAISPLWKGLTLWISCASP